MVGKKRILRSRRVLLQKSMGRERPLREARERGRIKMNHSESCCVRKRREPWEEQEKKRMINRLSRIEGQIKGIKAMVEEDRYCGDVLTQVAAAEKGLRAFSIQLAKSHFHSCVIPDIREEGEELANEFLELFEQLAK